MKNKMFMVLLIAAVLFVFTGCSSNDAGGPAETAPAETEESRETEAAETEAPVETEEGKAEGEPLDFEGRTMNVVTTSESYVPLFDAFGAEANAKVEFLSMSSGEVIARVEAEGGNPMADLWFGGGLDAFMAAKDAGYLDSYQPVEADKVDSRFRDPEGFWIAKGLTVVGFLVNEELLSEKDLPLPTTWAELADPMYKDEIIMANPAISGTNYGAVKGILDMMGEENGWEYLTQLNENIPFYGKRGKDPEEKVVAGEFAIGIIPADKGSFDVADKNNLTVIYPEDGIPWVPEGVAVFKNGDGADIAKAFIDFMLRDENQAKLAEIDGKDSAQMIKEGVSGYDLGLPVENLIEQDIATFGSDRDEILARWDALTQGK